MNTKNQTEAAHAGARLNNNIMNLLETDWQASAADDAFHAAERAARAAHESAALNHARMAEAENIKAGFFVL